MRQELEDEDVDLLGPLRHFPGALTASDLNALEDLLLDEVLFARYPPLHEGRVAPYGCLVMPSHHLDEMSLTGVHLKDARLRDVSLLRKLCDGVVAFTVRSLAAADLGFVSGSSEEELVQLARVNRAFIVQRHPAGAVRVYTHTRIYEYHRDQWTLRVYPLEPLFVLTEAAGLHELPDAAQSRLSKLPVEVVYVDERDQVADTIVREHWRAAGVRADRGVAESLLSLCLNVLASRRVGATLVWQPQRPGVPLSEGEALAKRSSPLAAQLQVDVREDRLALAALLAGVDGAALVNSTGTVTGVEAFLAYGPRSQGVTYKGGTRHTSAARFSHENADTLVFVVSADGPVTVFSDGIALLRMDEEGMSTWSGVDLWSPLTAGRERVEHGADDCHDCARTVISAVVQDAKTARNRTLDIVCPACAGVLRRATGVRSYTRIRKPWESSDAPVFSPLRPIFAELLS